MHESHSVVTQIRSNKDVTSPLFERQIGADKDTYVIKYYTLLYQLLQQNVESPLQGSERLLNYHPPLNLFEVEAMFSPFFAGSCCPVRSQHGRRIREPCVCEETIAWRG